MREESPSLLRPALPPSSTHLRRPVPARDADPQEQKRIDLLAPRPMPSAPPDPSLHPPTPQCLTDAVKRSCRALGLARHVGGDDWNLLQNVATGVTNYRGPGTQIDDTLSIYKRRAAGDSILASEKGV